MLAQGAYQVDSASQRTKLGLARDREEGWAPTGFDPGAGLAVQEDGRRGRRPTADSPVMNCSPATVKKALDVVKGRQGDDSSSG